MSRETTRFRRRWWPWPAVGAVLVILSVADHRGWLLARRPEDMTVYHGASALVARVVDGDTLELRIPDRAHGHAATQVHLWGVECPETASRNRPAEPFADAARELAQALTAGASVTLSLEPHRTRGAYDRLLAHVELPDGSSLAEALLRAGLARVDERWPHARLSRYARLEREARREGLGIWSPQGHPADGDRGRSPGGV